MVREVVAVLSFLAVACAPHHVPPTLQEDAVFALVNAPDSIFWELRLHANHTSSARFGVYGDVRDYPPDQAWRQAGRRILLRNTNPGHIIPLARGWDRWRPYAFVLAAGAGVLLPVSQVSRVCEAARPEDGRFVWKSGFRPVLFVQQDLCPGR